LRDEALRNGNGEVTLSPVFERVVVLLCTLITVVVLETVLTLTDVLVMVFLLGLHLVFDLREVALLAAVPHLLLDGLVFHEFSLDYEGVLEVDSLRAKGTSFHAARTD
jgi:hypothetical protein